MLYQNKIHTSQSAKGRLTVVTIIFCAIFSVLIWRLIDVQLVRGDIFWDSAEKNRWFELPVVPDRGVVLDRFGIPIVENHRYYTLVENPDQLYSDSHIIDADTALPLLATQSARVRTHASRHYPYGPALAPVIGYVGAITQEDLTKNRSLQPFGSIGKSGLELAFEQQLRGQLGTERFEVDARVRRQRQFTVKPPQAGRDIASTIDPILSEIAYRALGNQRGVVAVSDVSNGHILSLVSKPTYDPNVFTQLNPLYDSQTRQDASSQIQNWFSDEHQPFFNRAVSGQYPPGSIFKLVTALAGLETGVLDLHTTVLDEGVLTVGEFTYANWFWTQYGRTEGEIGLIRSLARSNDIFFYKAAEWIGPNRLADLSRVFGLGSVVGIEVAGEKSGLVPDPAWKQAVVGEPWYLGNTYHYGIGQGDVKTTPLQLLQLVQAFGNKGTMCSPRLVDQETTSCQELGVSENSVEAVMHGMLDACAPGGTSFPFFARNGAVLSELHNSATSFAHSSVEKALQRGAVACKTGTAEFGGQDSRGFRNTHGLWAGVLEPRIMSELSDHSTDSTSRLSHISSQFNPQTADTETLYSMWVQKMQNLKKDGKSYPQKIAIVVIVESDENTPYKEGSRDAAPVAKTLVDWMEGNL